MSNVFSKVNARLLSVFIFVVALNINVLPVIDLVHSKFSGLFGSTLTGIIGQTLAELFFAWGGMSLVRHSGRGISSLIADITSDRISVWFQWLKMFFYCQLLFLGFYITLWSLIYMIVEPLGYILMQLT